MLKSGGDPDEKFSTLVFFIDRLLVRLRAFGMNDAGFIGALAEAEEQARKKGESR